MVTELVKRRGRPRKEPALDADGTPIAAADPEPKREGKSKVPPVGKPSKEDITALIAVPNSVLASLPATAPDALSDEEVLRLAEALDAYKRKSEKTRTVLNKLVSGSALGALLITVISIAIPRLVRHGLFPAPTAEAMDRFNQPQQQPQVPRSTNPESPFEAFPRPNGVHPL